MGRTLGLLGLLLLAACPFCGCSVVAAYRACGIGGCAGDAAITAEVRALFEHHPAIEAPSLINVQTIDHVVYLYGLVDTEVERRLAGDVAQSAEGVTRVVNSVSIMNASR